MKKLTTIVLSVLAVALAGCASTQRGPADYSNADRGDQNPTPAPTEDTTTVVTPAPAPIPTKSTPEGSVLDHNSPDQQIVHP